MSSAIRSLEPNASLSVRERLAYGSGNFSNALVYGIVSGYLVYYYTDVIGLAAGTIGLIMLISRIFDGITDLVMGRIVDLTKSKKGKGRVWILRICVPYALASILLFSVPEGATDTFKYIFVFISYNLVNSFLYTALTVPYNSLGCLLTTDGYERGLLGIFSMGGSFVSGVFLNSTILKLVNAFGNDHDAWTKTLAVYAVVGVIVHLLCYFGTTERVKEVEKDDEKVSFSVGFKSLIKNKYWVMFLIANLVIWTMVALNSGSVAYYASSVLNDVNYAGTLMNAGLIPQVVFLFASFALIKKIGKGKTFLIGAIIMAAGLGVIVFAPTSLAMVIGGSVLKGAGNGIAAGCMLGITADTIDYSARIFGVRATGLGNAAISFAQKVAAGLGGAIMGGIMSMGGYDGMAEQQTASAILSIKASFLYLPIILILICVAIMSFYDLDKKNAQFAREDAEAAKAAEVNE